MAGVDGRARIQIMESPTLTRMDWPAAVNRKTAAVGAFMKLGSRT